jgi:hypothetical protein
MSIIRGSADKRTGVPHLDMRGASRKPQRAARFLHVILRPVFYENLVAPFSLQGSAGSALGQSTKLQMIAVDDIGWFARAFTDALL